MIHRSVHMVALVGALIVGAGCAVEDDARAPEPANLIEFRMVEDAPSEGSRPATLEGESLILAAEPVISDAHVRTVSPVVRSDRLILSMELTEQGRDRLRRATAEHNGRRMAFLFDGQVRSAPMIADTIDGAPSFQVSIDVSQAEADSLAARVRARWP